MPISSPLTRQPIIREQASKRPVGPFGTKPARVSAFISVYILMDTEALAGFAMPARASTFNSIDCTNSLGGSGGPPRGPPDAENRRFSGLIKRIHTNERRSPGGLGPKRPVGPFGSFFLITECLLCWEESFGNLFPILFQHLSLG